MLKSAGKRLICYSTCSGWSPAKGPVLRKPCLIPFYKSRMSVTSRPAQTVCLVVREGADCIFIIEA